ncbi:MULTISPECIES: hypothetical protein [unclassified Thiocapsa]|uniref:hypothetical protein n=1 Tax=unclassified Thiocapsa TaxID=2641286 RepID=UPI0035B3B317
MKCPFAAPMLKTTAACRHAREVVRRGGSEFDCQSDVEHARCEQVFAGLKASALAVSSIEDDPAQMPHSLLVKIQSGGLLGVQRLLGEPDADGRVADVGDLLTRACTHFGGADRIPYAALTEDMTAFKLERRAGRRRG